MSETAERTNPKLWESAKQEAKRKMGGKHSARAMQEAVRIYKKKGGKYKNKKTSKNSLSEWTKQDWKYSSKKSKGKGKYLPKKAWENLSSKEKQELNKSKYKANTEGKQFSKAPKKLSKKVSKYWKK